MSSKTTTKNPQNRPKAPRISAKIRNALRYRVQKGLTWEQAARAAGCSLSGIHAARTRPEVQELHTALMLDHINQAKNAQAIVDKLALDTIAAALTSDMEWAEKRKWVELLRREGPKAPQINVQNNVSSAPAGYAYIPPGAKVVEIENQSGQQNPQAIENRADARTVGSDDTSRRSPTGQGDDDLAR